MKIEEFLKIISSGESDRIEFKSSFDKDAIETVCAFANAKGGKIFIGVTDSGEIKGIDSNSEMAQSWINQIKTSTMPSVIPEVDFYELTGKVISVISVIEQPIKPVSFKGRYYKRIKNANHQMTNIEIADEHLRTLNSSWDYYPDITHNFNDISIDKVNNFIAMANSRRVVPITDDPLMVLNKFHLARDGKITFGAYLLFSKEETMIATIEMGRFSSETLIKDDITIKEDLFKEVDLVLEFVRKHINKELIITEKPQRNERWQYPLNAIREIVLNMIVHRDYRSSADSIVKIYDNKIEFTNPGGIYGEATIEDIKTGSFVSSPRNKLIASVFKEAGMIEKYGSGIKRVIEQCLKYGLPEPKFENLKDFFKVTIFDNINQKTENITQEIEKQTQNFNQETASEIENFDQKTEDFNQKTASETENIDQKTEDFNQKTESLTETKIQILNLIKQKPDITRNEMAISINKSEGLIKYYLSELKKQGFISREGSAKKGRWIILKKI